MLLAFFFVIVKVKTEIEEEEKNTAALEIPYAMHWQSSKILFSSVCL